MHMHSKLLVAFYFLFASYLYSQTEQSLVNQLFSSSNELTELSTELISIGVDAVWFCSEVNGAVTVTGTITQSTLNFDQWSYSASPNNKLVVRWANGDVVEYIFNNIDGYVDGDAEDFKNSHYMDFTASKTGEMNLHIVSSTGPDEGIIKWQRNIQGEVLFETETMTVNISHNGQYESEIGGGIGIYRYWDEALGQATSNSTSLTISEGYWRTMTHNSNQALFVLNTEIRNNSSATLNSDTYKFQNGHVFWAGYTQFADSANAGAYNKVIDANQWIAEGSLLKNNQVYGTVQFSSLPIGDSYGPVLICKLGDGSDILLHNLISPFITDVQEDDLKIPQEYSLEQNYPNPFNPTTTINYSIPDQTHVSLKVFDVLGRELEVLVNKEQPQGNYEVEFNASSLTSGVYFYKIEAGDFVDTKKMVLLR